MQLMEHSQPDHLAASRKSDGARAVAVAGDLLVGHTDGDVGEESVPRTVHFRRGPSGVGAGAGDNVLGGADVDVKILDGVVEKGEAAVFAMHRYYVGGGIEADDDQVDEKCPIRDGPWFGRRVTVAGRVKVDA